MTNRLTLSERNCMEHLSDPNIGRLYIHNSAFAHDALTSEDAARAVGYGIAAMRAYRTFTHHAEQAIDIGAITGEQISAIVRHTVGEDRWFYTEHGLLRHLGYQARLANGNRFGHYRPLLGKNARLHSTCFDDGYYTFSFSAEAAERMFEDSVPFSDLNRLIAAGEGPEDLVVVHGTRVNPLTFSGATDQVMPDLLARPSGLYYPAAKQKHVQLYNTLKAQIITPEQAIEIDRDSRKAYATEILSRLALYKQMPETWEGADPEYVETMMATVLRVIHKILRDPSYSRRTESFMNGEVLASHIGPHFWEDDSVILPKPHTKHRPTSKRGLNPDLYADDLALAS